MSWQDQLFVNYDSFCGVFRLTNHTSTMTYIIYDIRQSAGSSATMIAYSPDVVAEAIYKHLQCTPYDDLLYCGPIIIGNKMIRWNYNFTYSIHPNFNLIQNELQRLQNLEIYL